VQQEPVAVAGSFLSPERSDDMKPRKMRRLSVIESATMLALADRVEREVDATLAELYRRVAHGDDTALVPAVDRLKELGREDDAERLKKMLK
jgi:hypothetical protein